MLLETKGKKVHTPKKRTDPEPEPVILTNGHFNALSMIDPAKELPAGVRSAALKTCKACSLYPEADPKICRECPLPDFLRRL